MRQIADKKGEFFFFRFISKRLFIFGLIFGIWQDSKICAQNSKGIQDGQTAQKLVITRNLLKNGNFNGSSLEPWKIRASDDYKKPKIVIENKQANIKMLDNSVKNYELGIVQNVKLRAKTKHMLEFEAKTDNDEPQTIVVAYSGQTPKIKKKELKHLGFRKKIKIKNEWKTYSLPFTTSEIPRGVKTYLKFNLGKVEFKTTISFRNIALGPVKMPK